MCGHYYTKRQKQEIAERMRAKKVFEDPFAPDFNIAPTAFQPIVRQERDSDQREMVLARWGLVPFFAESLADFKGFGPAYALFCYSGRDSGCKFIWTWCERFAKRTRLGT